MDASATGSASFTGASLPPPADPIAAALSGMDPSAADPRLHLNKQSGRWAYEDEDGIELEWEPSVGAVGVAEGGEEGGGSSEGKRGGGGRWVPVLDEEMLRAQQEAYSVSGVDEEAPADAVTRREQKRKAKEAGEGGRKGGSKRSRGNEGNTGGTTNDAAAAGRSNGAASSAPAPPRAPRPTTSVFVSGLPLDVSVSELASVFGRYGLINEDASGAPRIKLYTDAATGHFKGEALVTYFKAESVDLAITVLDESCLRAALGQSTPVMKVSKAEWGAGDAEKDKDKGKGKAKEDAATAGRGPDGQTAGGENGRDENKSQQPPKTKLSEEDKKKLQRRREKMMSKLTDWDSDEDSPFAGPVATTNGAGVATNASTVVLPSGEVLTAAQAASRVVLLRRMFTLAELDEDPALLLDLKEDVREEAETLGKVTNVVLFDKEPEGLMSIKYATPESARACVQKMDGRFFSQRTISAELHVGKLRFRRSDVGEEEMLEMEKGSSGQGGLQREEDARKDSFGAWLEGDG